MVDMSLLVAKGRVLLAAGLMAKRWRESHLDRLSRLFVLVAPAMLSVLLLLLEGGWLELALELAMGYHMGHWVLVAKLYV